MTLITIVASYAIGCFSTAYYLFRHFTGQDIRVHGSGNAGATNIGRELSPMAFMATFLVDAAKGAAVVALARFFDADSTAVALAMLAVTAGHIWPVQLGFRGGKGVATALGAVAAYDLRLLLPSLLLFCLVIVTCRRFTPAGLIAIVFIPISGAFFGYRGTDLLGMVLLLGLVFFAHRANLRSVIHRDSLTTNPQTPSRARSST